MDLIRVESIQLAIKLLILSIFLGYIMIWIMMPTNVFWLHWSPRIHAETDSMFFGQQGANILVYTSPILLIATLGCIYLHLDRYTCESNNRTRKDSSRFATWARPVFVRGPLGIVSWTELSFIVMFIVLLIWSVSAYVHGMFKNITKQSSSKIGELVWEVKLDSVALMLGLVGNICFCFLFFPINRGSSILRLVGLTSESSVKYHIWLGHTVLTLFTAHGVCYIIYWATTHQISEMLKWDRDGISNVAGEVALLSGIVMWITSHSLVRRTIFELFFYTHHLYIVFVFFFILHVGFSYSCIMLPGFYLFVIDRFLRFLQSQQRVFLISARVLPCHVLELNFSKDPRLSYNPSSIVFIKVKSISKLQWHPFTVTSNSNMDPHQLSIVIKSEGSWSRNLYDNLSSPTPIERLEISVEGPHSPTSTSSYLRHEMLVMVSGGSGVTPFISIIRELVFIANTDNEKNIPRIILVATFKKSEDLAILDLLLPFSGTSNDVSRVQIQIQVYVTREKNPTTEKSHKTIWFKPSVSDKPISEALAGSRSWLWLGAITSSSFIVFLLLIGLLNRYYIYPIDHNTYSIYSQAARSTITTSVLCASVVITATLAFLWNKNKNNKDKNQIQIADSSNQVPEPWLYEVDRELGSFPNQSLKQVTTVHYGERPNMKKILSECEELNVGVLVSGPKKMRQEVAGICCSSKNLHYKSFSFNW
ncbi:hypothetical protein ABFS83_06G030600 [Erythranthe nasuta]